MMAIYVAYTTNWVGAIEVPLGANMIPKRAALELEYSAIVPMYSEYALLRKKRFGYVCSFPKQRTHT